MQFNLHKMEADKLVPLKLVPLTLLASGPSSPLNFKCSGLFEAVQISHLFTDIYFPMRSYLVLKQLIQPYIFVQCRRLHSTMSFAEEKTKFLQMPLAEKRSQYSCKSFVTLDTIPSWTEYFNAHKDRLLSQVKSSSDAKGLTSSDANSNLSSKVSIWQGDITTLEIDAIVNAANKTLLGGGGVDGAIHRGAGPSLKQECSTLNGCDTGDAKITGGYHLPAKYIIHTVGPQGEKPKLLQSCYETCLNIALDKGLSTIAFPCISTGIYGYPQDAAAKVALRTVRTFLDKNPEAIKKIVFCLFLPQDVTIYENLLQVFFPVE